MNFTTTARRISARLAPIVLMACLCTPVLAQQSSPPACLSIEPSENSCGASEVTCWMTCPACEPGILFACKRTIPTPIWKCVAALPGQDGNTECDPVGAEVCEMEQEYKCVEGECDTEPMGPPTPTDTCCPSADLGIISCQGAVES